MLVNKAALGGALSCIMDAGTDVVSIEPDGTIVATNRMLLYVCEPVRPEVLQRVPFGSKEPLSSACVLMKPQVKTLYKAIVKDTLFRGVLEHASLTLGDGALVSCEVRSGTQSNVFELRRVSRAVGDWRGVLKTVWKERCPMAGGRWIYNRSRLAGAVAALEAACKYDGSFAPVFAERSGADKVLWRSVNELTGQRVWVIFTYAEVREGWLELDPWERAAVGGGITRRFYQK